ncbi:hypothetical protein GCM10009700_17510 [Brevibacterium sanguinis]|uniref:sensor histidine kinase n=1 Tax=Brevibacterium sanguinis TaxID=232444 RepID=UPI0031E43AC2
MHTPAAPPQPADTQEPTQLQAFIGSEGWYWLTTVFAGVVLVAVGWPVYASAYGMWVVVAMLIAVGQAIAPVLAIRLPTLAVVVSAVSSTAGIAATAHTSGLVWPWAVTATIALGLTCIVLGLRHRWPHLVTLWAVSAAIGAGSLLLPHAGDFQGAFANAITTAAVTAGVGGIAVLLRLWLTGRRQLAVERRLGAEETARRTELDNRNRIAQELHDVVAHSMSVISVQATTAQYRLPDLDDRSREEFDSIAEAARQALTEMRGLLTILRGGRDADLAPQPTVDDIPGLVSATRSSGAHVDIEFAVDSARTAPTTGLTAFRVVQEGLSNALRHASGAPIRVDVAPVDDGIVVSVLNGAPGAGNRTAPDAVNGTAPDPKPMAGAGFGLTGMRERVEALGGTLTVGPTPDGGFAITAVLPTT